MFNKICTVSFVFFMAISLFAQANKNYDGPKPENYPGSKAFVFSYTPFQSDLSGIAAGSYTDFNSSGTSVTLFNRNIYGVGFKYFFSNNWSILGGLNFGFGSSTEDVFQGTTNIGTDEESGSLIGVAVDVNYHLNSFYSVSPYLGANINFGTYSYTFEEKRTVAGSTNEKNEFSSSNFGIGLNIGFDWFFTEGLALGGKYTIGFKSLGSPEYTYTSGTTSTTTNFGSSTAIGTSTGTFTLSVYF